MEDWRWMGAAALGRGIAAGEIDPVALCEVMLEAATDHPHSAQIYARMTPDRARSEARAAAVRARGGRSRGPLDGLPVSWKDLFDTAGVATEAGSRLLEGRVPRRDAEVVVRATNAGLVCLGKTHMSELAFSGLGLNPNTGTPPGAGDPGRVPGGSSSGAAVSVRDGVAAGAFGSDTGGSVRLPAAWNDLVGLKTVQGSLPMRGVVPLCPRFDTLGTLARSVEDAALLWNVIGGPLVDLRGASIDGVRLAVLETAAMADLEPSVADGFAETCDRIMARGGVVDRIDVPAVAAAMPLSTRLFAPEAYGIWGETIEADPDRMYPPVRERFRGGRAVSAPDYVAAWETLIDLRRAYSATTARYDAVILPTCPILPPPRARLETDADFYAERNLMTLRNTRIGNLMGLPGLTLPTATPSVGILLQAPDTARLLRLGAAVERALA